jgi:hypothetical protein
MLRARILKAVIASFTLHILLSLTAIAADPGAMAKATYLPTELMQLPPQVTIVEDVSGYWADDDVTLIRCIELLGSDEKLIGDDLSPDMAEGLTSEYGEAQNLLLFYDLSDSGEWKRIGSFSYPHVGQMEFEVSYGSYSSYLKVTIGNGGNARCQKGVCCFVFTKQSDGSVTFHDETPDIDKMQVVDLYPHYDWDIPAYVAYPTMGNDWEVDMPFYHAANPDRYILLKQDEKGTLKNVSTEYKGFYLEQLGYSNFVELQESAVLGKPVRKPTKDEDYLPMLLQVVIYYHDMGYPDEGIRLARRIARAYGYADYNGYSVNKLIEDTVVKLNAQDKLIKEAIDKYNAEISAASW